MATGSTPIYGIPYPVSTDQVNVHSDLQQMASSIENIFGLFNVSLSLNNTWTGTNIFQTSTTTPTVKITQAGNGHALVVEDTASDTSPFIIDNSGNVIIGKTTSATAKLDVVGNIALTGNILFSNGTVMTPPAASGALSINPMTTKGDIVIGDTSGAETRLAGPSTGSNILTYDLTTNAPAWSNSVENLTLNLPNIYLDNNHSTDTGHISWDDTQRTLMVGNGVSVSIFRSFTINENIFSADHTFNQTDSNKLHQMDGQYKFIVPEDLSVSYPVGTQISVLALSTGVSVEFAPAVTAFYSPGNKLRAPGSMATLIKLGANRWVLTGDLTA